MYIGFKESNVEYCDNNGERASNIYTPIKQWKVVPHNINNAN